MFPSVLKSIEVQRPALIMFKLSSIFSESSHTRRLAYTELCFLLTFLSFQPWRCFSDSLEKAQLG